MNIPKAIEDALYDPKLIVALKKEPSDMDFYDKRIIDATAEFCGHYLMLDFKERLLS